MKPWNHLVEADDRLRRLKRAASQNVSSLKRYIKELNSSLGAEAALLELVLEYDILPDVEIRSSFYPEDVSEISGSTTFPAIVRWIEVQLHKGNMFAWCRGVLELRWLSRTSSHQHLGGISARNVDDADRLLLDHGLQQEAAFELLHELPTSLDRTLKDLSEHTQERMLKAFLTGKEDKEWVRYE